MKRLLLMVGLLGAFGVVGCQQEDENLNAGGVTQQEDVREGGPEEVAPREETGEAAVPEYEERQRGEMADGDQ